LFINIRIVQTKQLGFPPCEKSNERDFQKRNIDHSMISGEKGEV
jgi:hypothetical protein